MLCDLINTGQTNAIKKVLKAADQKKHLNGFKGLLQAQEASAAHRAFLIILKKCCRDFGHMLSAEEQRDILSFLEKTASCALLNLGDLCESISDHLSQLWNMVEEEEEEDEGDEEIDLDKLQVYRKSALHIFIYFLTGAVDSASDEFGETG
jgi:hypothetical protein